MFSDRREHKNDDVLTGGSDRASKVLMINKAQRRRQNTTQTHVMHFRTGIRRPAVRRPVVIKIVFIPNKAQRVTVTNKVQRTAWWVVGECVLSTGSNKAAIIVKVMRERERTGK
jgi:hypothetical protein